MVNNSNLEELVRQQVDLSVKSYQRNQALVSESFYRQHAFLVNRGLDYRSQVIKEIAFKVASDNPSYSIDESIIIAEKFFDTLTKKFGSVAQTIRNTFAPKDWEKVAARIGKESDYEDILTGKRDPTKQKEHDALDDVKKIIDNQARATVAKALKGIEATAKQIDMSMGASGEDTFPVSEKTEAFEQGLVDLAAIYDGMKKEVQDDPGKAVLFNAVIKYLRDAVEKWASDAESKAGGVYSYFGGGDAGSKGAKKESVVRESVQTEAQKKLRESIDKAWLVKIKRARLTEAEAETTDQQTDRGAKAFASAKGKENIKDIANFESLKGPIITLVAGVLATYVGAKMAKDIAGDVTDHLLSSDKFKKVVASGNDSDTDTLKTVVQKALGGSVGAEHVVSSGDGLASTMTDVLGQDFTSRSATVGDLRDALSNYGNGNLDAGIKRFASAYGSDSGDAMQALNTIKNADASTSAWDSVLGGRGLGQGQNPLSVHPGMSFQGASIPAKAVGQIVTVLAKKIPAMAMKTVAKSAAGAAASASGFSVSAALSATLLPLGIVAIVGATTTMALRAYQRKKSRTAALQQLYNLLETFPEPGQDGAAPKAEPKAATKAAKAAKAATKTAAQPADTATKTATTAQPEPAKAAAAKPAFSQDQIRAARAIITAEKDPGKRQAMAKVLKALLK